jgi:iron complex outermembrane receptor protein
MKTRLLILSLFVSTYVFAEDLRQLAPTVVTATRVETNSFDVPASIDVVDNKKIHDQQLQTNLSESLVRIPGVILANRQNFAQDLQISSRGFGARAPFGVKGMRIIIDDIPATMPDGAGQGATIAIGATDRIEILKGPFSSLYGNGAGGVLQAFTEDGKGSPKITNNSALGSYQTAREELKVSGKENNVSYLLDSSWFSTDGYRNHSSTDRYQTVAKVSWDVNDDTKLKFSANSFHQNAEDPLGLTLNQLAYNPRMAGGSSSDDGSNAASISFNTRKKIDHNQVGLVLDKQINDNNSFKVITYYGTRKVTQFQSFTALGVVDLDRGFGGINLRYSHQGQIADKPLKVTGGLDYDKSLEIRKAYDSNSGVAASTLLRNENDAVHNLDPYLQATVKLNDKVEVTGGARHSNVKFNVDDRLNATGSVDYNSGNVAYSKTIPSLGVLYHVTSSTNFYANAGEGFETPTFAEIAYSLNTDNSVNSKKSNYNLKPSESKTYEVGMKSFINDRSYLTLALFTSQVKNELAAANNASGKVAYQNIPETERNGIEMSLDTKWSDDFKTFLSYAYLDATTTKSYDKRVSNGLQTIASGSRIPGISKNSLYGEALWSYQPFGFSTGLEVNWRDKYYATDNNSASGLAKSFVAANIRAGFNQKINNFSVSEFVRVNNLFDRNYSGSVIVNDANSRFFEPAPGRNYLLGVNASYQF